AMPSSCVGPEVNCSGSESVPLEEKRCRQMWKAPPASELRYIHLPSGDQAANQQAPGGPTGRLGELASTAINRHGSHLPRSSISAANVQLPSGDGNERWAIAPFGIGTYRSRSFARLSSAATIFIWLPWLFLIFSENRIFCRAAHASPEAFGSQWRGSPPKVETSQLSHSFLASTVV